MDKDFTETSEVARKQRSGLGSEARFKINEELKEIRPILLIHNHSNIKSLLIYNPAIHFVACGLRLT